MTTILSFSENSGTRKLGQSRVAPPRSRPKSPGTSTGRAPPRRASWTSRRRRTPWRRRAKRQSPGPSRARGDSRCFDLYPALHPCHHRCASIPAPYRATRIRPRRGRLERLLLRLRRGLGRRRARHEHRARRRRIGVRVEEGAHRLGHLAVHARHAEQNPPRSPPGILAHTAEVAQQLALAPLPDARDVRQRRAQRRRLRCPRWKVTANRWASSRRCASQHLGAVGPDEIASFAFGKKTRSGRFASSASRFVPRLPRPARAGRAILDGRGGWLGAGSARGVGGSGAIGYFT